MKTMIIITIIVSLMLCYYHDLVAANNKTKFKAQAKMGEGYWKGGVQPTCVRWQPLQRCRAAPAICSTVCEGCMKGRNGRRVSLCQSHLGEKCWKTLIFHTVSGVFEGKMKKIRQKMRNLEATLKNKERWMAERSVANYFTPLVGPEGFPGSEVEPRCIAEDCI